MKYRIVSLLEIAQWCTS